ncbi:molybdopterin guanine dinucleotide biosynthesis accessory protein MobB [Arboricoccus pini]|uniref:Molybdopterin guanine dinucleotide biosynthesis accessory protein MobB n=1 Tax=Arboricoccus pini TaxID=1963835 RepID=A0A212QZ59_9PROT|nr:molybdopterin-guanine dinucleotide biosynthesis protein B [Arboricoccus pini]SNB65002.1 molybdopterin guanine dinucleotide biosynthesis accessory protein MobB [Arboricoccus pini]
MTGQPPERVFGIVGFKNNGKTVLTCRLIDHLKAQGYRISTIKHAHHDADIDQPGRDSWRHRESGATEVLLSTSQRWMHVHELRQEAEPALADHLARMTPVDLVLVEGFKRDSHAKIEVHRAERDTPLIAHEDPTVVALATDQEAIALDRPVFHLDDIAGIAAFMLDHLGIARRASS